MTTANQTPSEGDLRVWWIPQVPMKQFHAPVKDIEQAKLLLRTLAEYDMFQYHNRVKGDYCNAGGLEVFDGAEWFEWDDPETGDDIDGVMREEDIAAETPNV